MSKQKVLLFAGGSLYPLMALSWLFDLFSSENQWHQ